MIKRSAVNLVTNQRLSVVWFVAFTMILDVCTPAQYHQDSSVQEFGQDADFLAVDFLLDGERERRLRYHGITAKETSTGGERGISLRQITDGKHFIQMIHSRSQGLMDCDYTRRRKTVDAFLDSFRRDAKRTYNVSRDSNQSRSSVDREFGVKSTESDKESNSSSEPGEHSKEREQERARIEAFIENGVLTPEDLDFNWNQRREGVQNATFVALTSLREVPRDMRPWLEYAKLRKQCQKKHRELRRALKRRERQIEKKRLMEEKEINQRRFRRGITEYFIAPGTKWCGAGSVADSYTQLGGFSSVDQCCRSHDDCTNVIGAIETKFDFFNFSPFTMSHCGCDRRFRTCLKLAGGTTADLVGKLFFNVVQTKCFVFKTEKVCTKYTWWKNTCKKYTKKKRAVLRNNMAY